MALAMTLFTNLTLTPVVLATFPRFFIQSVSSERYGARVYRQVAERYCSCCPRRKQSLEGSLAASVNTMAASATSGSLHCGAGDVTCDTILTFGDTSTVCSLGAAPSSVAGDISTTGEAPISQVPSLVAGSEGNFHLQKPASQHASTPEEMRLWWAIARCTTR